MSRRVALVRTDVSEKRSASVIMVTNIIANLVPNSPILVNLMTEALLSSETSVHTRATRRHFHEDGILHSHRSKNLKGYMVLTGCAL
jgi:hypothetical protein